MFDYQRVDMVTLIPYRPYRYTRGSQLVAQKARRLQLQAAPQALYGDQSEMAEQMVTLERKKW